MMLADRYVKMNARSIASVIVILQCIAGIAVATTQTEPVASHAGLVVLLSLLVLLLLVTNLFTLYHLKWKKRPASQDAELPLESEPYSSIASDAETVRVITDSNRGPGIRAAIPRADDMLRGDPATRFSRSRRWRYGHVGQFTQTKEY